MTTQAKIDSTPVSLPAAADLSAKLFRFGKHTASGINVCSVAGEKSDGIIGSHYKQTGIVAGDPVDFYIERIMLVEAGEAFAVDTELTTDANGKAVAAGAGDAINAVAIDAAADAGDYVRVRSPFAKSASAENVANAQTTPGTLVVFTVAIPDEASGDTDVVMADKVEVLDFTVQARAAGDAGNSYTLKNAGNAISDAIGASLGDKDLARAGEIDDANSTIDAGGTLRISHVKAGGSSAALAIIYAVKRA